MSSEPEEMDSGSIVRLSLTGHGRISQGTERVVERAESQWKEPHLGLAHDLTKDAISNATAMPGTVVPKEGHFGGHEPSTSNTCLSPCIICCERSM